MLASIGALLVAFFGSLIALLIPALILWQRAKRLDVAPLCAIAVAGLAAWVTLWILEGGLQGYGDVPSDAVRARDYVAASCSAASPWGSAWRCGGPSGAWPA